MFLLSQMTVTDICSVIAVNSPRGKKLDMVHRPSYGITFCTDGQITYVHNGKKFVSDRHHALLLPKGADYTLYCDRSGVFPLINFECTADFTADEFVSISILQPEGYLRDFEKLQKIALFQNRAKAMSIVYDICSRMAGELQTEQSALAPAMAFLEKYFADPALTNRQIADCAGISEVYFRRLFRQAYGITPKQYILEVRIRKAMQLLAEQGASVTAVAEQCGFSSVYHFSRAFKAFTGYTATAYRQRCSRI